MKKNLKPLFILMTLLVIIFVSVSLSSTKERRQIEGFMGYMNNTYRYYLSYPSFMRMGTDNDYGWNSLEVQEGIYLEIPGESTIFSIDVDLNESTTTPLLEYAQRIRNMQLDNSNMNVSSHVGDLKQTTFAGNPAYSFTLDDGFNGGNGTGYALGNNTYNYVLVENPVGKKLIIHYLIKSKKYPDNVQWSNRIIKDFNFRPVASWDKYGQFDERSCYYGQEDIKTNSDYSYKNSALGFSLDIPSGWFVPLSKDDDPHFVNCGDSNMGSSFEIQGTSKYYDEELAYYQKALKSDNRRTYPNLIKDAVVVEYVIESSDGAEGDGWGKWYKIIYLNKKKSFNFASYEGIENNYFINSFKLID